MNATAQIDTLNRLLDPVRECLTPEVAQKLVNLRADSQTHLLLDQLATKNAEGTITAEELAQYDALISVGNLIAILQAKAGSVVSNGS
jgi:Mg2+/Co2+ transporter CorC